ncbi:capsular polysaccharide transport system ATP-binding protein [Rhodovulum bhavnagarense]|uniref:Capsular polysaccharide transport system ATP-binding protein n=1 Tax=Rhodovulum bhavnagarense TaxID=992286 RepID=A0A4R2RD39_9RHOB|nr:ABC transporter ATP-binding protein [Rhodovulum bhavnagarense]TCP60384.1 capsular polysaccharide transport system ATP-binding protein [Rhodovulum bhavnagarense]
MIELRELSKTYVLNGRHKVVADRISAVFPPRTAVAVLGRNGAGKSSLLKMISGAMDPDSGEVIRHGTVSWPVGFAGSFHPELTGLQNTRFIARVYGVDTDELVAFVRDFAQLGQHFGLPVRTYSSGMRSRLAFGVSMGIPFDTYLVDEITAVGDASFKKKSDELFLARLETAGAIMVSHALPQVKRLCTEAAVLEGGRMRYFPDINEGIAYYQSLM